MKIGFRKGKPEMRQPRMRTTTPVNSPRPAAFSYHANRSLRPDPTSQGRAINLAAETASDKRSSVRIWTFLIAAVVIFSLLGWFLSISTTAKIVVIDPAGYNYQPRSLSQYQQAADKALGGSLYNRLKLTISSSDIANKLEQEFPEISHVAVTVHLIGRTPTVYIQLAKPSLVYDASGSGYILSSKGFIIGGTSIVSAKELAELPAVSTTSTASLRAAQQVLTGGNVEFIQIVNAAFSAKHIAINKMTLAPMAEELDVYPLGVGYYIKFNLHDGDALQQVGTYLATLATLKQQNKTPSQYVDVRVTGRAYYK